MKKFNFLRMLVAVSLLALIIPPLYTVVFLYPAFTDYLKENIEKEAVQVADHLAYMFIPDQSAFNDLDALAASFAGKEEKLRKQFGLEKIKLFLPSGEIVASSDFKDIGTVNRNIYFKDIVAKGEVFTKIVTSDSETLEGQKMKADVVETYIPIIRDGVFVGAFEIYCDISEQKSQLDVLLKKFHLTFTPIALGLLLLVIISSRQINRSISERRQAQESLISGQARFTELFNNMNSGVVVYEAMDDAGSDFKIVDFNHAAERIEKVKKEEILGKSVLKVFPGTRDFGLLDVFQRVWLSGKSENHPVSWYKDDRIAGWRENFVYKLSTGEVITVYDDVTERKLAEYKLEKMHAQQDRVLSAISDGICEVEMNGIVTFASFSAAYLLGYKPEELVGRNLHEVTRHSDADGNPYSFKECPVCRTLIDGDLYHGSTEVFYRKDGRSFPVEFTNVPIIEEADIHGSILTFRDISRRKQDALELEQSVKKLRKALAGTIQAMAMTVETRDPYTAGHQRRSANLARAIAQEMGLIEDQIDGIRMAGAIHDLGKISVPAEILSKPGRISDVEFSLIMTHPEAGYDILKNIEFQWPIAQIVLQHHERLDGSGYPQGLIGDDIILEARVMAVADVVEAMASHRPYRPALGLEAALEEISRKKGSSFDPVVVEACLRLFNEKGFVFQ